jgi:hypothetical protein
MKNSWEHRQAGDRKLGGKAASPIIQPDLVNSQTCAPLVHQECTLPESCSPIRNAKSYSRILNTDARMDTYKEYNSLIATVSQINAEKAEQKKIVATKKIADKSA